MNKLILLGLTLVLFAACNQQDKRYTQQSPEIDIVKKIINEYNDHQYDLSDYAADTTKFFFNTTSDPIGLDELIAYHEDNDVNYSSRTFLEEGQFYEMVVTDEGKTWVNAWLEWQCTLKENGQVISFPIHLTYQFIDGKITRGYGYWNEAEIALAMQEIEREKAMSTD